MVSAKAFDREHIMSVHGLRHARKPLETTVLMNRGGESLSSEIEDISATGVRLRRPHGWDGESGQLWVLDMLFEAGLHINVEATVARVTHGHVCFAYARIPEDKQVPLWNLLGGHADRLEPWDDMALSA